MALSLLVLLIPVALVLGLYRFLGHETPPTIDPAPAYEAARNARELPILQPSLPTGWQVQVAQYRREAVRGGPTVGVLRIGVRSPAGGAMQLVESAAGAPELTAGELGDGARVEGTVLIGGRSWTRYSGTRAGEHGLRLTERGRTVLVYGRASDDDLVRLAATLE
jgi:hypothetical protein